MSRRPLRSRLACALALVALAGCGPSEAPGPAPNPFPVRLLPAMPGDPRDPALVDDDLSDLSPWWVVHMASRAAAPADGHPALVREANGVRLTDSALALVRLADVPAKSTVSLGARLGAGAEGHDVTGPCDELLLLALDGPTFGSSPITPAALAERLGAVRVVGEATWISLPDASGFARARTAQAAQPAATGVAIVVAGGAAGAGVELRPRQQLAALHDVGGGGDAPLDGPVLRSTEVGGERRPALVLPPFDTFSIDVDVPPGARSLTLGLALAPGAVTGAAAQWTLECVDPADSRPPRPLASGELRLDEQEPHAWHDLRVDWPASLAAGPITLRFAVEGDEAVVFGQPLLLGGPAPTRPNLLLVSLDTLRADHLGSYGYERSTSPRLDALAADGVVFLDHASVAPYTLPTHATLLSGRLPLHHGVVDSGADRLDASAQPYLPALLADAGYTTAAFTGGGFLSAAFGFAAGFDRFSIIDPVAWRGSELAAARYARNRPPHLDELERRADLDAVGDWIEAQTDQPWFAFVHTYAVHDYAPPPEDLAVFDRHPELVWGRDPREVQRYLNPDVWPGLEHAPEQVERLVDLYDATIRFTDRRLGELLDRLAASGRLDDTLLIVTSDHGEEFLEHGGLRHSHTLYQEMLHVPLIVRAPGGERGRRVRDPVGLADVLPTTLELLGLPSPEGLDGRSLAGFLRGGSGATSGAGSPSPATPRPSPRMGHVHTLNSQRASLQAGSLKLIRGEAAPDALVRFRAQAPWELYDLAADPGETINLAERRADDVTRLSKGLSALEDVLRAGAVRSSSTSEVSPEVLAQLRALGYVSAGDDPTHDEH